MLSVEQEKRQAGREREESETNSRDEIDSLRAKEQGVKENNQAIMRWVRVAVCMHIVMHKSTVRPCQINILLTDI